MWSEENFKKAEMFLVHPSDNNPINLFCDMQTYFSLSLLFSTFFPHLFTNVPFMGKPHYWSGHLHCPHPQNLKLT